MAQLVTLPGGSPVLACALGKFWGSSAIEKEMGAPLRNSPNKIWVVAFDLEVVGFSAVLKQRLCSSFVVASRRGCGIYGVMLTERLKLLSGIVTATATAGSLPTLQRFGFVETSKVGRFTRVKLEMD